ncbi:hypothetical protein D3C86_443210 [compost metagenome]
MEHELQLRILRVHELGGPKEQGGDELDLEGFATGQEANDHRIRIEAEREAGLPRVPVPTDGIHHQVADHGHLLGGHALLLEADGNVRIAGEKARDEGGPAARRFGVHQQALAQSLGQEDSEGLVTAHEEHDTGMRADTTEEEVAKSFFRLPDFDVSPPGGDGFGLVATRVGTRNQRDAQACLRKSRPKYLDDGPYPGRELAGAIRDHRDGWLHIVPGGLAGQASLLPHSSPCSRVRKAARPAFGRPRTSPKRLGTTPHIG